MVNRHGFRVLIDAFEPGSAACLHYPLPLFRGSQSEQMGIISWGGRGGRREAALGKASISVLASAAKRRKTMQRFWIAGRILAMAFVSALPWPASPMAVNSIPAGPCLRIRVASGRSGEGHCPLGQRCGADDPGWGPRPHEWQGVAQFRLACVCTQKYHHAWLAVVAD